jgi:hypothetical protein
MPTTSTVSSINIDQPFFPATFQWRCAREELGKSSKNTKSRGEDFALDFLGGATIQKRLLIVA